MYVVFFISRLLIYAGTVMMFIIITMVRCHCLLELQWQEKTWKNRRSQKLDKMQILDLQSNLQSEIQAKESIRKELSTAKAVQVSLEK